VAQRDAPCTAAENDDIGNASLRSARTRKRINAAYTLIVAMGFLLRLAGVASGGLVAAGGAYAYMLSSKRNQKHHAQDVPEGETPSFIL
jgi:hypothetical protein